MQTAKQSLLIDTLGSAFDINKYVNFINEFFNGVTILTPSTESEKIWGQFVHYVKAFRNVARYSDGSSSVLILAVKLQIGKSANKGRSNQRGFVSKLLSGTQYKAAIVAFYSDDEPTWRLSFVELDYEFAGGRAKERLTPAKRYSYLVGLGEPSHTAQERLYPIFRNEDFSPTIENIKEAFSVDAVTKEFFAQYREKYLQLKEEYLDGNEEFESEANRCGFTSEQFAKKLMGQLAFLYFLQKKGWLGVKVVPHKLSEKEYKNAYFSSKASREVIANIYQQIGEDEYRLHTSLLGSKVFSEHEADILATCFKPDVWGSGTKIFIRDLFVNCEKNNKNYFDDYLEPLFYDALNQKRGTTDYFKKFNCKIPFLNGGLFEPLDEYDWENSLFGIPNSFFSNEDIKGEDNGDGILDIFDRYNFTMNEDEPLEKEVAVDPEMLGKIFENLLDVKDRKSKGAFYTPRQIVHYMCQESLINYILSKFSLTYEEVKDFILYGEIMKDMDCSRETQEGNNERIISSEVFNNLYNIDKALVNIKVADPAVGSGAFPLGMLNEIVKARMNITEYLVREIPADKKFDRFNYRKNRHPYKIKWETIKNSIFAVDIEPSAVDIAKLRLWLSLVVEQEIDDENPVPHALPNLDCNIMCGNSLVDEYVGIKLFDETLLTNILDHKSKRDNGQLELSLWEDQVELMTEELFKEQDRMFGEDETDKKRAIKKNIDSITSNLIKAKLSKDNNKEGLSKYEESLNNNIKPYFVWQLEFAKVFKENGGFDVVIGNPPYVRHEKIQSIKSDLSKYSVFANTADLLVYFFERGNNIIRQKGYLCLITSNKYMRAAYGKKLRCFLKESVSIKRMIDFKDLPVFDAAAYPIILLSEKENPKNNTFKSVVVSKIDQLSNFRQVFDKNHITFLQEELNDEGWIIDDIENNTILKKVYEHSTLLGELLKNKLKGGIKTGLNAAYIIDSNTRKMFIYKNKKCAEIIKPYIVGRDIKKYKELNVKKYLICIPSGWTNSQYEGENTWNWFYDNYEPIAKHFIHYEEKLKKRSDQGEFWWELRSCDYYDLFDSKKIIYAEIAAKGHFTLDEIGVYCDMTAFMLDTDSLYILGLLNSKLITFIFSSISSEIRGGFLRWKKQYVNKLPIAFASEDKKSAIVDLVININQLRDSNTDTSDIEIQIDELVYELYGLTNEEIKIIEEVYING